MVYFIMCLFSLLLSLITQIIFNPMGYNYLFYPIVVFIISYKNEIFKSIKEIKFGYISIKKTKTETKKYLVTLFKILLKSQVEKRGGGFAGVCRRKNGEQYQFDEQKCNGFISMVDDFVKTSIEIELPSNLKEDLNRVIKENSRLLLEEIGDPKIIEVRKHKDIIIKLEKLKNDGDSELM